MMLRFSHVALCCSLFSFVSACGSDDAVADAGDETSTSDTTDGTTDTSPPDMTGEELYMGNCAVCHGAMGEGTSIAYEIQHPHRGYSTWVVRNGRASIEFQNQAMLQFTPEVLSDAELELIFDYLDSPPQPTTGEGLYLDYCRNCHGVDALGGVTGAPITESPIQDFIENVRQGFGGSNYGARTMYMSTRTSAELSDAEIQLIFDYVGTL